METTSQNKKQKFLDNDIDGAYKTELADGASALTAR